MLTASELMTPNPFVIPSSARIREAVRALQDLEVRHLPVVDGEGDLIGMLSDRDLRSLSFPSYLDGEWLGTVRAALDARVGSLMTSDVLSVDIETGADEIVELMLQQRVGALPVLDADGKLAGIVSYVDLLNKLALEERAADEESQP